MFEVRGLFSINHLVFILGGCLYLLLMLLFCKGKDRVSIIKILRVLSILVISLEIFKFIFEAYVQKKGVDGVVPLYFCSMYLYIIPFIWTNDEEKQDFVLKVLMYYCFIPGLVFSLMPLTAVPNNPIMSFSFWHSCFYHYTMVFTSLIIMINGYAKISLKEGLKIGIVLFVYCLIVFIIDKLFNKNYMFINYAPEDFSALVFLTDIVSRHIYPFAIMIFQSFGSPFGLWLILGFVQKKILKNRFEDVNNYETAEEIVK